MSQPTLFPAGPVARRSDPTTSRAAGARQPISSLLHHDILSVFERTFAADGLTDDELCSWYFKDRCEGTVKKRRTELAKAGLLVDSGRTRPTRTGTQAIVWKLS